MKRIYRTTFLMLFFAVLAYLGAKIYKGYNSKKEAEIRIQTLPNVSFSNLGGKEINLRNFDKTKPMVLIYFHRNCEHCQYEAKEIGQNPEPFVNCQLIMVSANDSIDKLENFCNKYNLWEVDNIEILIDKENRFKETFGKAVIPSVYIYDKNQKLKKRYLGETKPEAILSEIALN